MNSTESVQNIFASLLDESDIEVNEESNFVEDETSNEVEPTVSENIPKKRGRKPNPEKLSIVVDTMDSLSYVNKLGKVKFDENDMFTMNEFGEMDLTYMKVKDPNGHNTDYFSSHCNIKGQETEDGLPAYHTSNQLSRHYVAIHLEDLVKTIKDGIDVSHEEIFTAPFVCTWKAETTKTLKTIEGDLEKDLFLIYSGFDAEKIFDIKQTKIELYMTNSYDGKGAIFINFVMSIVATDESGNNHVIRDFFSLRDRQNKFLHKGIQVSDIEASLSNIEKDMNSDINILKNNKFSETDIDKIASKLKTGKAKVFRQRHENIPAKYNNIYFSLLILSSLINENYNTSEHFNIQPIVTKIVNKVFIDHEKALEKAAKAAKNQIV